MDTIPQSNVARQLYKVVFADPSNYPEAVKGFQGLIKTGIAGINISEFGEYTDTATLFIEQFQTLNITTEEKRLEMAKAYIENGRTAHKFVVLGNHAGKMPRLHNAPLVDHDNAVLREIVPTRELSKDSQEPLYEVLASLTPEAVGKLARQHNAGDGEMLYRLFGERIRFNAKTGEYLLWQSPDRKRNHGLIWVKDNTNLVRELAKKHIVSAYFGASQALIKQMEKENTVFKKDENPSKESLEKQEERQSDLKKLSDACLEGVKRVQKTQGINNLLTAASSIQEMVISGEEIDNTLPRYEIPLANGVLNIRTGIMRPALPGDYICSYIPVFWDGLNAPAEKWENFFNTVFPGDVAAFMQRIFGYGFGGDGTEQFAVFLHGKGEGGNGKGVIFRVLRKVLTPKYADSLNRDAIKKSRSDRAQGAATPHLMSLIGKRLAFVSELEQGANLDLEAVKEITGNDFIKIRANYGDEQSIRFYGSLIIAANDLPKITNEKDGAFWRRCYVVPMEKSFVDRPDPKLPYQHKAIKGLDEILSEEASGILAWIVRGYLAWKAAGELAPPEIVKTSTEDYKGDANHLEQWIAECCAYHPDSGLWVSTDDLFVNYSAWCETNGIQNKKTKKAFSSKLRELGYPDKRMTKGSGYLDIELLEGEM